MKETFPEETMRDLAKWVTWFSIEWRDDEDHAREWHPDFAQYLTPDQRHRKTKRVMRRLRRSNIRAYEVCYRVLMLGERIDATTAWLNERAERNRISYPSHRLRGPHYTHKDTLALLVSGLTYARQYW